MGVKPTKAKPLTLPLDTILFAGWNEGKITTIAGQYNVGYETLADIIKELQRPGLDPRENMDPPSFKADVLELKDLEVGMMLDGVVRNVVDFGAFVDI